MLFLVLKVGLLSAQESNYWSFTGNGNNYFLNFNYEPPKIELDTIGNRPIPHKAHINSQKMALADNSGQLLFYSYFDTLYSANGIVRFTHQIDSFVNLTVHSGVFCNTNNPNEVMLFYLQYDSSALQVGNQRSTSLRHGIYNYKNNTVQFLGHVNNRFTQFYTQFPYQNSHNLLTCRYFPALNKYWIAGVTTDSLYMFEFNPDAGIERVITYPFKAYYSLISKITFNHRGNQLAIVSVDGVDSVNELPITWGGATGCNRLALFNFDAQYAAITFNRFIWNNSAVGKFMPFSPDFVSYKTQLAGVEFSPNDSLLYALTWDPDYPLQQLWQFNLFPRPNEPDIYRLKYPSDAFRDDAVNYPIPQSVDLKLGPNGKIYINNYSIRMNAISYIAHPNKKGEACKVVFDAIPNTFGVHPYSINSNFYWGFTPDIYKPVKFRAENTCTQRPVRFVNLTDSSYFLRYRFFFGDGDSCELDENNRLTIAGNYNTALPDAWGVGHVYRLPGNYLVKLKAINAYGGHVWYSDSIVVLAPPVANFAVADTTGCQWIGFNFSNTSSVQYKNAPITYTWQFGNGRDTVMQFAGLPLPAAASAKHTYTQNGLFLVNLIVHDGFCADTFTLPNRVQILPAPRPGMDVSPANNGCSPLTLTFNRSFADAVDSIVWLFGDGSRQTAFANSGTAVHTWYHTLSAPQTYAVVQRLYGPTGCITADTVAITVKPGFELGYVPVLHRASVENGQTLLQWQGHPHAGQYHLFKNNAPLAQTADTFYWLKQQNADDFAVAAANGCGQLSPHSNSGKIMLLKGQNLNNKAALLQWTAYQDWTAQGGISHYTIEAQNPQGVFEPLATLQTTQHTDNGFIQNGMYQRCYRVAATQSNNPQWVSHSNTLCLGYEAVIFVPDAFSPNNDGLNDVFTPFNIGFKNYTLSIYNRWGQKIAEGQNWDGTFNGITVPPGIYTYTLTGKTGNDENVYLKGQVSVVR